MQAQNTKGRTNEDAFAAIDIGSNTIRLAIACYTDGRLVILKTDEELVRIGESVNASGYISALKSATAVNVLRRYRDLAAKYQADPILAVATEAIRKAQNKDEFLSTVLHETGLVVHLIDGETEAQLTFYGATYELEPARLAQDDIAVMDLGGGSTEFVLASHGEIGWRTSLAIGSGKVHDHYLHNDPPDSSEITTARVFVADFLHTALNILNVPLLLVTGGSAQALWTLSQHALHLDAREHFLQQEDLERCEQLLSTMSADEIAQRYQLEPKRAQILLSGVLIIRAIMKILHLKGITVSSYGIREGLLLAYAHAGERWLEQLEERKVKKVEGKKEAYDDTDKQQESESFAQSGRSMLLERAKAMLKWRADVLANKDPEAVHKMRVASRRLRAVLDAYKEICNPRAFKDVYKQTQAIADALGQVRDTDVMMLDLQKQSEQVAEDERDGINWLVQRLSHYRKSQQHALAKIVRKIDKDLFVQQVKMCLPEKDQAHG